MNELNNPYFNPSWGSSQVSGFPDSGEEGKWSQWFNNQDYAQGITSGLSAGAANEPVGDFSVDPWAGYKSSAQGFMGGGAVGAAIGGVTAQLGQFSGVNKALNNLDTSVEGTNYDAYGRPSYNGQSVVNANQNISALRDGDNAIIKSIDPATHLFGEAFGTRRKIRRKRAALQRNIGLAKNEFNIAELGYRNQFNQRQSYLNRRDDNSRMYNLYRFQN